MWQDSRVQGLGHWAARSQWTEWTHPGPSAQHLHSPLVFGAVNTHAHEAWNMHSEPLPAFPSDSPSHTEQF